MTEREQTNRALTRLEELSRDPNTTPRTMVFWYFAIRALVSAILTVAVNIPER
jgi:hypothetical protein